MMFNDFSAQDMPLVPLKTTTQGLDIYNMVKRFFIEEKKKKKIPVKKLLTQLQMEQASLCNVKITQISQHFYITPALFSSRRYMQYDNSHHRDHN